MPSSSASATSSSWARSPVVARLAVAGRATNAARMPCARARRAGAPAFAPGGVHTNTRSTGAGGQVVDRGRHRQPEHLAALEVGRRTPGPRSRSGRMLCSATNPNLPGWLDAPATTTPRGSKSGVSSTPAFTPHLDQRVDRDRAALDDDEGFTSTDDDVGLAPSASAPRPSSTAASASRSTAGSPRTGPSSAWLRSVVEHLVGVERVERHEAERDVGQRLGEHAADADHHARPELRVGVHAGDELARAGDHRRDEQVDGAVLGLRGREQLGGGVAHRVGVGEPEAHQPALGLVRDARRRRSFDHHRVARARRRRATAAVGVVGTRATGSPGRRSRASIAAGRVLGERRVQRRSYLLVAVLPELVAQHPLQQLARLGARQLVAHLVARAAACSRRRRSATNASSSSRSSVAPGAAARSRTRSRPTRRRGCRTPRRRGSRGARGSPPRSRPGRCSRRRR